MTADLRPEVTLDRVAFVGGVEDSRELDFFLSTIVGDPPKDLPKGAKWGHLGARVGTGGILTRHWNFDGLDIQVQLQQHRGGEALAHGSDTPLRIEFNPNKARPIAADALWIMSNARATRVDVALDYWGADLQDWIFLRRRVKACTWRGVDGIPEAQYLGSWSSRKFHRVYDKAREQGRSDLTLLRCEGVERPGKADPPLDPALFDGVQAFHASIPSSIESTHDRGLVALTLHYPHLLADSDYRTRKRIRAVMDAEMGQISPTPAEVYADRREGLTRDLGAIVRGQLPDPASIYRDPDE